MSDVLKRGNDSVVNFIGGLILGGPAGFILSLLVIMPVLFALPLSTSDDRRAWIALAVTTGTIFLLAVAVLLRAVVTKKGRSFASGFFLSCVAAAYVWLVLIAGAALSR